MDDNVTPIRPDIKPVAQAPAAWEREKLLGYAGSIEWTPLDFAISEQRAALWDARAVIQCAIRAIEDHFGSAWPAGVPMFARALRVASEGIDTATGALEAPVLEDRAIEIARAKEADHG